MHDNLLKKFVSVKRNGNFWSIIYILPVLEYAFGYTVSF